MTEGDCKDKWLRGSRRSKCGAAPRGNSELALALHRFPSSSSLVDFDWFCSPKKLLLESDRRRSIPRAVGLHGIDILGVVRPTDSMIRAAWYFGSYLCKASSVTRSR